jgi:hypothetical protein
MNNISSQVIETNTLDNTNCNTIKTIKNNNKPAKKVKLNIIKRTENIIKIQDTSTNEVNLISDNCSISDPHNIPIHKNTNTTVDIYENNSPPTYLSIKNAHPRDAAITFEDKKHEYTVNGEKGYTSVTTFVHKHFASFDSNKLINTILNSKKMKDPTYKYYGMNKQQILDDWENNRNQAAKEGTKMHYDIECYYNLINNENTSIEFVYFKDFVKDFPQLKAYRTEWMVYYEEYRISGSIDMVFENLEDGTLQIYDWKRTKGLEYEAYGNKRAITPCISTYPDTNFWHYSLQLNMYKRILEIKYGKTVSGLYLVCLHPSNYPKTYERVEVPFLDNDISLLLKWWKEQNPHM